ncbi:leucine-rich repeat-containing protein 58 [Nilaparvata lugens]|uniref:leucine-rich repeat-containing protein 58 n=1 Tax=Nilaparvata lugens TaxID=108931 RepID=UPI00193C8D4A|nr:leucine-rich repeat-containing protein 58 [Nilaparvata lugens]
MEIYSSDNSDSDDNVTNSTNSLNFSFAAIDSNFLEDQLDLVSYNEVKDKTSMLLHYNSLTHVPENLSKFMNLRKLDISNNRIYQLPDAITRLPLRTLIAKNNFLDEDFLSVKTLEHLANTLEILNLSGNNLSFIPEQILQLTRLKYLYLGENRLQEIPHNINRLIRLEILNVGGNQLISVPSTVGQLSELRALILSNNQLDSLPASVANLNRLTILQLHKNKLRTLPTEIIALKNLSELSLRDNPLVVKFVSDMVYEPPTLQELSARTIKLYDIPYSEQDLPRNLIQFLSSAHHCLNPQCQGVFFDNRVEHVKFVDFCGKYRLPLMQYLCSSKCRDDTNRRHTPSPYQQHDHMLRKVLLSNFNN